MAVIKWESAAVTEELYTCEYTSAELLQVTWFCTNLNPYSANVENMVSS